MQNNPHYEWKIACCNILEVLSPGGYIGCNKGVEKKGELLKRSLRMTVFH
jgi:hypothetical protein